MSDRLLSVGLDVGTTSTQMVVSRLQVHNTAGAFSVPKMQITDREILYKSPVHFTPMLDESHVDAESLKNIVEAEYRAAGIEREQVDTGAVIITGETSRKENAQAVLKQLAEFAGDFVVTTAGPDLESVLAAKGAGAVEYSRKTGKTLLHMDIGGGTSNLALIRQGEIVETGCLNVGGRLMKTDSAGVVSYVSPVLEGLCSLQPGMMVGISQIEAVARTLVQALEMAAGLRSPTELLEKLTTKGTSMNPPEEKVVLSFSGGVADCIDTRHKPFAFGDIGPVLGKAIRESVLCAGEYRLGEETIRATVIGAGCHSTQLSGSTVFCQNMELPIKNLPVIVLPKQVWQKSEEELREWLCRQEDRHDGQSVLFLQGALPREYGRIKELGEKLAGAMSSPAIIAMEQDMAKALGQVMALGMPKNAPLMCMDGLFLQEENFLDVGVPVGPAFPVVVKMLIFEKQERSAG